MPTGTFYPNRLSSFQILSGCTGGEPIETESGSAKLMKEYFPKSKYQDVAGLCRVAPIEKIREDGYSLNPGRYVGVAEKEGEDFDFYERLEELNEELEQLNAEARDLEERIAGNITRLIEVAEQ